MKSDVNNKIQLIINLGSGIDEDRTRSLMNLVRKEIELMSDVKKQKYLILNLFCNWSAHTKIDKSMSGLKILARINDALVKVKNSVDINTIQAELTNAIGFKELYSEFKSFLSFIGVCEIMPNNEWTIIANNLIEIIRDVPITFPNSKKFKPAIQKIYNQIAKNAIKLGSGVKMVVLSYFDYEKLGFKGAGKKMCLLIRTEDTSTIIVPLNLPF